MEFNGYSGMVFRCYRLGGAGLSRLSVGDKIDRWTRPYQFYSIFYDEFSPTFYHACRGSFTYIFNTHRQLIKTSPHPTDNW